MALEMKDVVKALHDEIVATEEKLFKLKSAYCAITGNKKFQPKGVARTTATARKKAPKKEAKP